MNDYPQADQTLITRVKLIMSMHVGYHNRIDRWELVNMLGASERAVRDALSNHTEAINNGGYYLPECNDEPTAEAIGKLESRALSEWERVSRIRKFIRQQAEPVQVKQLELMEV